MNGIAKRRALSKSETAALREAQKALSCDESRHVDGYVFWGIFAAILAITVIGAIAGAAWVGFLFNSTLLDRAGSYCYSIHLGLPLYLSVLSRFCGFRFFSCGGISAQKTKF